MNYKWTVGDVDALTLPFAQVMLKRIGEDPGADEVARMKVREQREEFQRQQDAAFAELRARVKRPKGAAHG